VNFVESTGREKEVGLRIVICPTCPSISGMPKGINGGLKGAVREVDGMTIFTINPAT
jgi:hypothetical protein